jgi:hypothetical protein
MDDSVIPLHVYGHDRSAHDDVSYPPTNALSVLFICGSPFVVENRFNAFSRIPGKNMLKVKIWLLTSASYISLGL